MGGIGDTVMAFAMMRRLRALRPHARITALAMWPQSAELIVDLGVFDELLQHHFQRASRVSSLRVVDRLRRRRFDISLQAYPANRWEYNFVHGWIGARRRIGHVYDAGGQWNGLRGLLTDVVPQRRGTHNIVENLRLLGPLGDAVWAGNGVTGAWNDSAGAGKDPDGAWSTAVGEGHDGGCDISLGPLDPRYGAWADRVAERVGGTPRRPILGIHAGSSSYKNLDGKRWPAEHFAELCRRASTELGLAPVLLGTAEDRPVNARISRLAPRTRVIEPPSIRHAAALIQQCSAFVSNDSAPAHIAKALHVPTIMLVGPTDPAEIGHFGTPGATLSANLPCAPCYRASRKLLKCTNPCRHACLQRLHPTLVLDALGPLLGAPTAATTDWYAVARASYSKSSRWPGSDPRATQGCTPAELALLSARAAQLGAQELNRETLRHA